MSKHKKKNTEIDQKTNDKNNVDFLLTQQLEEEQNTDVNEQTNINNDKVDLDYLLALSIEQQDIMEIEELFENNDSPIESNPETSLITDSEIIVLLKYGIDIESLLNTYSSLTKEHIISLKQKIKPTNKQKKKKRKRQKSNDNTGNNQTNDNANENENKNEEINEFLKQFTNFVDNKHKKMKKKVKKNSGIKQKSKKKKRRKKNHKSLTGNKDAKKANVKKPICRVCTTSFETKQSFLKHLKKFPSHCIKNPCNWIGHRKIPKKSNWLKDYKYGKNGIVHDNHDIYFYHSKHDCYKLIKTYEKNDFWFSYNISLFYNKKYCNNSFYLFIICINGNNDNVDMCNILSITQDKHNNNQVLVECLQVDKFMNKVINIDPAKGILVGDNNQLLMIMAHANFAVKCEGDEIENENKSESEMVVISGCADMKFIVYNLERDEYEEKMINLKLDKSELYSKCGGDYHLGIIGLNRNSFVIFNKDIMFKGIYNSKLKLNDDNCLRFEKIYNKIRFNDIVKYDGEVFWNFVYLKYDNYILVFGGYNCGNNFDEIVVFDINNNYWFKSKIKLPLPMNACNNNCFIDHNNYVHLMGGAAAGNCLLSCHYSMPMRNMFFLKKDFDKLLRYWVKQSKINENGWVVDFNSVIYKYYLF